MTPLVAKKTEIEMTSYAHLTFSFSLKYSLWPAACSLQLALFSSLALLECRFVVSLSIKRTITWTYNLVQQNYGFVEHYCSDNVMPFVFPRPAEL